MRAMILAIALAVEVSLAGAPAVAGSDPPEELISELMCPVAGGVQPLAVASGTDADWMRGFIRTKASEGWSRQRIVDTLVRQYGEGILAVPPKEGFSLAAWVTPFATIFGGFAAVGLLLTRWLRLRQRRDALLMAEMARGVDEEDLQRYEVQLREDLERFE